MPTTPTIALDEDGRAVCAAKSLRKLCADDLLGHTCRDWSGAPDLILDAQKKKAQAQASAQTPIAIGNEIVPVHMDYYVTAKGHLATCAKVITPEEDISLEQAIGERRVSGLTDPRPMYFGTWYVRGNHDRVVGVGCPRGRRALWHRLKDWAQSKYAAFNVEVQNGMLWALSRAAERQSALRLEYPHATLPT